MHGTDVCVLWSYICTLMSPTSSRNLTIPSRFSLLPLMAAVVAAAVAVDDVEEDDAAMVVCEIFFDAANNWMFFCKWERICCLLLLLQQTLDNLKALIIFVSVRVLNELRLWMNECTRVRYEFKFSSWWQLLSLMFENKFYLFLKATNKMSMHTRAMRMQTTASKWCTLFESRTGRKHTSLQFVPSKINTDIFKEMALQK